MVMEIVERVAGLYRKHRRIVIYLIFGGFTTFVNIATYFLVAKVMGVDEVVSNAIAWAVAVAFAYVTNRIYVFESAARTRREVAREMASFVFFRLASGAVEMGLFALCVKVFFWNDIAVKVVLMVLVIVLNYVFSKLFVFRRGRA